MVALFFEQLQAALCDDLTFASDWQGVIAIVVVDDPWYVSTTGNIPAPVCVHGEWGGGPDLTVRVASTAARTGLTTAPETIPALAAAGQVTVDDPDAQAFTLARLGAMVDLRNDYLLAHPAL